MHTCMRLEARTHTHTHAPKRQHACMHTCLHTRPCHTRPCMPPHMPPHKAKDRGFPTGLMKVPLPAMLPTTGIVVLPTQRYLPSPRSPSLGTDSFTRMVRPMKSVSLSSEMASLAPASSMVTKPKPRLRPVSRSEATKASDTCVCVCKGEVAWLWVGGVCVDVEGALWWFYNRGTLSSLSPHSPEEAAYVTPKREAGEQESTPHTPGQTWRTAPPGPRAASPTTGCRSTASSWRRRRRARRTHRSRLRGRWW